MPVAMFVYRKTSQDIFSNQLLFLAICGFNHVILSEAFHKIRHLLLKPNENASEVATVQAAFLAFDEYLLCWSRIKVDVESNLA